MDQTVDIRELNERIQRESSFVDLISMEMNKVIIGQKHLIESLLIGLLSDGHILLEGVPGLAKTLAITDASSFVSICCMLRWVKESTSSLSSMMADCCSPTT